MLGFVQSKVKLVINVLNYFISLNVGHINKWQTVLL